MKSNGGNNMAPKYSGAASVGISLILSMEKRNGESVAIVIGAKLLVGQLFGHLCYLTKVI